MLATLHALLCLVVALRWAFTSRGPGQVVVAVCYLAGADLLWRMTGAGVFWEFGKYAVCAVLLVSAFRYRPPRFNGLALLYFGLLIPSTLLTLFLATDFSSVRSAISFNLSGPLALAVCTFCLSGVRLNPREMGPCLLAILGPITAAGAICLLGTASLGANYEFGNESNFDTSGGFGPNQVSTVLGWGMLMAFFWLQSQRRFSAPWWLGSALLLIFAAQATLTFSRTGIWIGTLTIGVAALLSARASVNMLLGLAAALLLFGVSYFVVFQSLDEFTGGKLSQRYSEKGFSRREDIARGDLTIALRNPLLGVGTGRVGLERQRQLGIHGIAHTEFTRLLAEHGLAGLLALGTILWMSARSFHRATNAPQRGWTGALVAFSLLFMMASGMRLAVPSVALGLAMVVIGTGGQARPPRLISRRVRLRPSPALRPVI